MTRPIIFIWLLFTTSFAFAQNVGVKISNNVTAFPISGISKLANSKPHPGIDFMLLNSFGQKNKHHFVWEGDIGFISHRFFQNALRLNGTVQYVREIGSKYQVYAGLGGGYWHSFYQYGIFKMNDEGVYKQIASINGRPQFSAHMALGVSKNVHWNGRDNYRLQLEYRGLVHGFLAKSYVPLVPYNILSFGVNFPTSNLKKGKS